MNDISKLNDRFRLSLGLLPLNGNIPGRAVMTAGIAALAPELQVSILSKVRSFNDFTEDNDPYGEHDFGAFDLDGPGRIFWKIDYYAPDMCHGSENPADLAKTVRVLTIMLASEY